MKSDFKMPIWGYVVIGLTVAVSIFALASISYTIGHVILTLTAVETPMTEEYMNVDQPGAKTDSSLEKESLLKDVEVVTAPVPAKPITSSLPGTFKHITSIGGFRARWRGLKFGLVYFFIFGFFCHLIGYAAPRFPGSRSIVSTLVAVIFVRIHAAWTHATIAMPSQKRVRDRLLPRRLCWRQLAIPTFALMTVPRGLHYAIFCTLMYVNQIAAAKDLTWLWVAGGIVLLVAAICVDIFVALPLLATLSRIEAALLPEDEDTIVPVDRSFGGKVVPNSVAGTCAVATFKNAFKSIDGEARRRMAKVYFKMFIVITGVLFIAFHAVLFELWAIMGDKLPLLLLSVNAKIQQQM